MCTIFNDISPREVPPCSQRYAFHFYFKNIWIFFWFGVVDWLFKIIHVIKYTHLVVVFIWDRINSVLVFVQHWLVIYLYLHSHDVFVNLQYIMHSVKYLMGHPFCEWLEKKTSAGIVEVFFFSGVDLKWSQSWVVWLCCFCLMFCKLDEVVLV